MGGWRGVVATWAATVVVAMGCTTPAPACGPANCAGCCGASGICLPGSANDACGSSGAACVSCAEGLSCTAAACVSLPPTDAGTTGVDAGMMSTTREVFGRFVTVQRLGDGGTAEGVGDLSQASIAALVERDGGYQVFPGLGDSTGAFRISNVPPGRYLFRIGTSYVETDRSEFDIHEESYVRPADTLETLSLSPSTTTYRVTGLTPWNTQTDTLNMSTPQLGQRYNSLQAAVPSQFTAGTTSVTLPFNFVNRVRVEAAKGDETFLWQHRFALDGDSFWGGAIAAARLPPYTQLDGVNVPVDVALVSAPSLPTQTLPLDVDLAAFATEAAFMPPSSYPPRVGVGVHPARWPELFAEDSTLWYAEIYAPTPMPASMTFGTPFPSDWSLHGRVIHGSDVAITVAGTPGTVWATNELGVIDEATSLFAAPVRPRLGPVEDLTLDGVALDVPRTGVGRTPRVAWKAPRLGTPTTYFVGIARIGVSGGQLRLLGSVTLSTATTSLLLPPDLLAPGNSYYLQILAVSAPFERTDFSTRRVPYAWSSINSAVFTP